MSSLTRTPQRSYPVSGFKAPLKVPVSTVACQGTITGRVELDSPGPPPAELTLSPRLVPRFLRARTVRHADEVNLDLQKRIIQLSERVGERDREMRYNMSISEQTRVDEASIRAAEAQAAAKAAKERADAALLELAEAKSFAESAEHQAKRWKQKATDSKNQCVRSEREVEAAENMVLCLQGQLVHALSEAEVESRKRKQAEEQSSTELCQLRSSLDAMRAEVQRCRREVKEAERACKAKEVDVVWLEGKLVRAIADVEGEHQKRQRVADQELAQLRSALDDAKSQAECFKQQVRTAERTCATKKGEVFRLEGKLGRALFEVSEAKENASHAEARAMELQVKLMEQEADAEAEKQHLRSLKNKMAREKRDAQRQASSVGKLHVELKGARERLKQIRKEVNTARGQLSLGSFMSDASSGEQDDDPDNSDEDWLPEAKESTDLAAARTIARMKAHTIDPPLQQVEPVGTSSMPTWRAIRGKGAGRGAPKLEWGTRLVIYMLLALLVPPASIGLVIVSIVLRTAPWLKPTAPTAETVKRCRFELRFFEEALAARRVASAFRIRGIGFDETTKLGNTALTSNVTVEPTEGAPLEDVILRAAYCPLGSTADQIVRSIETNCMERLRGRLRQWKTQFEKMYPADEWTGPEGASSL